MMAEQLAVELPVEDDPTVTERRLLVEQSQRDHPRVWPPDHMNRIEWATMRLQQIMEVEYTPEEPWFAPSLFSAVITELCTEVRSGVFDAISEWELHPISEDTQHRIRGFKEAVTNAEAYTCKRHLSPGVEDEVRNLYTEHISGRNEILALLLDDTLEIKTKRELLSERTERMREGEVAKKAKLKLLLGMAATELA